MNQDRGWVRPIAADSSASQMDPISPAKPSRRAVFATGLVLTVLIVGAVAGALVWRGLKGDPFGSARSIPTDMDYVVSFDALALSDSASLQAFVDAFGGPMFDAGLIDQQPGDLVAAIDREMSAETGFTLTNDILPWIGRSVSIAGTVPEFQDAFGSPEDLDVSFLLSADVRDAEAAGVFVEKLRFSLEDDGVVVDQIVVDGQPGYRFGEGDAFLTGSLVLTDDTLLVGISEDVAAGLEARKSGQSMAESATYLDTMTRLPADQMLSYYVSGRVLESIANLGSLGLYGAEPPATVDTVASVDSFGGSIGLVEAGLLVTYVTVGDDSASFETGPDSSVIDSLPAETLGFFSVGGYSDQPIFDSSALDQMGIPAEDLEASFGIDIGAVLDALSGSFTAAAVETRDSSIAGASDVPVGVIGVAGLTDPRPLEEVMDAVAELANQQGLTRTVDGPVTSFSEGGQELISYSFGDELVVVGTGAQLVGDVADGRHGGLAASDLYRELDGAVVGDGLVVFADIGRILRLVPMTSGEAAVFTPIRGVGVGAMSDGGASVVEALLLVDY